MNPSDVIGPLEGGCQCGQVRYRAEAVHPADALVCHCRMCQIAVGAPFFAAIPVAKSRFAWTTEPPAAFASSSIAERHFCSHCGTTLSYHPPADDHIAIAIFSLDTPDVVAPTRQVGVESKSGWLDQLATLPEKTSAESMGARLEGCVSHQFTHTPRTKTATETTD